MTDLTSEITNILSDSFDVDMSAIAGESALADLGVDSVATVELAEIIKEKLGVTIGEDELTTNNTIDELLAVVNGGGRK